MTTRDWSASELADIDAAEELRITVRRRDGTLRAAVPIWVVVAAGGVYVRTWYRRDSGWFGRVLASRQARIEVPQVVADVAVDDVGAGETNLRSAIDAAYRAKYARCGVGTVNRMVADDAAATTLGLAPDQRV